MMQYKVLQCEECENLVHVEDDEAKPTFVCPACGTINDRTTTVKCIGNIEVISEELVCNIDKELNMEELLIEGADEDLAFALNILLRYGWKIKFKGNKV